MQRKGSQVLRGAARPLPKQKSAPTTTCADAKPIGQNVLHEGLGRQGGEGGVEGQLEQVLHPKPRQPVGAGFGIHQAEGRGVRGEVLAGVRLEGDDPQRGRTAGKVDDRLMAPVDAVEVAHGDGCTAT